MLSKINKIQETLKIVLNVHKSQLFVTVRAVMWTKGRPLESGVELSFLLLQCEKCFYTEIYYKAIRV